MPFWHDPAMNDPAEVLRRELSPQPSGSCGRSALPRAFLARSRLLGMRCAHTFSVSPGSECPRYSARASRSAHAALMRAHMDRAGGHESITTSRGLRPRQCLRRGIGRHRDGGGRRFHPRVRCGVRGVFPSRTPSAQAEPSRRGPWRTGWELRERWVEVRWERLRVSHRSTTCEHVHPRSPTGD